MASFLILASGSTSYYVIQPGMLLFCGRSYKHSSNIREIFDSRVQVSVILQTANQRLDSYCQNCIYRKNVIIFLVDMPLKRTEIPVSAHLGVTSILPCIKSVTFCI